MRYILLIILLYSGLFATAQPSKYEMGLSAAVDLFYQMQTKEAHQLAFNKFEQLSKTYPSEWLPMYYGAIIKARMSILNMGNKDATADEAIQWVAKSKMIQVNDEILCAESLANSAKMAISPMTRWLSYESRIKSPLKLAKKINPNNPRIYVLEAAIIHRLPGLFGGGCKAALPIAKKAAKLLEEQENNRGNLPRWGMKTINEILTNCGK
ncbi:MAG: hypothetical protein ACOVJ8_03290 [Sediminibacterium sp.]